MYKFKNKVSEEDFLAFYKHYLKKTMFKPLSIGIYGVFLLFMLIGPIITRDYTMYMYLAFFVLITFFVFTSIPRKARKLYESNKDSFQLTYTMKEDVLQFEASQGKNEKLWSEFHTLYETQDHYFIYLKNKRGLIFTKSSMNEENMTFLIDKCKSVLTEKNIHLL